MTIPVWVFKAAGWLILGGLSLCGAAALYIWWRLRNVDFKINW